MKQQEDRNDWQVPKVVQNKQQKPSESTMQHSTAALQSPVKFHGTKLGQELHSNASKHSKNLVFCLTRPGKMTALRWLLTPSILWELHSLPEPEFIKLFDTHQSNIITAKRKQDSFIIKIYKNFIFAD